MRHLKRNHKLGRSSEHRNAMLANLVCSLIKHKRVTTTLPKAKAARAVAEKLLTLGKRAQEAVAAAGTAGDEKQKLALTAENIHCRRLAAARLRQQGRNHFPGTKKYPGKVERVKFRDNEDVVHILFDKIAPLFKTRNGGYTRILRLGIRRGDSGQEAILEWVETPAETALTPATTAPAEAAK
jgi:large subunit ribosomal protein L17